MSTDRERLRGWARRLSVVLLVAGALGLVEVGLTVFWQEPFSSLWAKREQDAVGREVDRLFTAAAPRVPVGRDGPSRAERLRRSAIRGGGIGRIEIPEIDVDVAIVEGTETASLTRGPGHYPQTDLPGEDGTVAVAGHRTTYGAPFRHIDALKRGDRIEVTMPYGRFRYAVERLAEVTPDRVDVVEDVGRPQLVLSACTPLFSSARRIVVFARQISPDATPAGRTRDPVARSGRPEADALPGS